MNNKSVDHIIIISLDTLRSDCINFNPFKLWPEKYQTDITLKTPSLDSLCANSAFFPNCISAAPYTSTSHATIFTGKWPSKHGLYEFFNRKLKSNTIFTYAKRMGYTTSFKVDFPVILGEHLGFTKDVDSYIIEDDQLAIEKIFGNKKTFSFIHFGGLHIPYGFHNMKFGGDDYVNLVERHEQTIGKTEDFLADRLVETYRDKKDMELLLRYKKIIQFYYTRKDYNQLFSLYLEGVNYFMRNRFDSFINQVIERLSKKNYLLVLFGDHGEEYDQDSYGHHNSIAEGVIRIPVLFTGQEIDPKIFQNRIRSVDIAPTILDIMGYRHTNRLQLDGATLYPAIFNSNQTNMPIAYAQAYTSEASEFVDFQQKILRSGKKTGSLKHNLFKECAYDGNIKLSRQNYFYTENGGIWGMKKYENPTISLELIQNDLSLKPISNVDIEGYMNNKLDEYNRSFKINKKFTDYSEDVRKHLMVMGYNV